jgi:hypothetical protein
MATNEGLAGQQPGARDLSRPRRAMEEGADYIVPPVRSAIGSQIARSGAGQSDRGSGAMRGSVDMGLLPMMNLHGDQIP